MKTERSFENQRRKVRKNGGEKIVISFVMAAQAFWIF